MKLAILGAPGAGKGTRAKFLTKHYGIPHISTGDLLREQMKNKTEIGIEISALIEKGELVPDEIVTAVLKERIFEPDCSNGFLLDGYPRTLSQAEEVERITGGLTKVISVHVEDEVAIERISGRRVCSCCGATFHTLFSPPKEADKCDFCGAELIQRKDDKSETVKTRLEVYHREGAPIKRYFKDLGKLVIVDGTIEPETIAETIIAEIEK